MFIIIDPINKVNTEQDVDDNFWFCLSSDQRRFYMFPENAAWYYLVWPWAGLGGAVVLSIFLFFTDYLRGDMSVSRWRDRKWIAWLGAVLYLFHNVEEYGISLTGTLFAFPTSMNTLYSSMSTTVALPPLLFYAAVNIPLFWIVAPLAACRADKKVFAAFGMAGLELINAVTHIASGIVTGYNPGLLTSVVLFLPYSVYVITAFFGNKEDGLGRKALAWVIFSGIILHALPVYGLRYYGNTVLNIPPQDHLCRSLPMLFGNRI